MSSLELSNLKSSKFLTILLATSAAAILGKVIFVDLPPESQAPAASIVSAVIGYVAQVPKISKTQSEKERLALTVIQKDQREISHVVFSQSWETDDMSSGNNEENSYRKIMIGPFQKRGNTLPPSLLILFHLQKVLKFIFARRSRQINSPSSRLNAINPNNHQQAPYVEIVSSSSQEMKSALPPPKKFFFDQEDGEEEFFYWQSDGNYSRPPSPLQVANFLVEDSTQPQLRNLAKDICDHAIKSTNLKKLESLNLTNREVIFRFYLDVYLYLRVWLKNSIQFGLEMPDIGRSISDTFLYVEAFKFLNNERIECLFVSETARILPDRKLVKMIRKHLDFLIKRLQRSNHECPVKKWVSSHFWN